MKTYERNVLTNTKNRSETAPAFKQVKMRWYRPTASVMACFIYYFKKTLEAIYYV